MLVVLEEGNSPLPTRFPPCYMFVPWESLNHGHPTIALCTKRVEQKQQRLEEKEEWAG